ncbi:uncharacterized protein TRIVIDRAFT_203424 [Trichoderma virens Gv29-8]|uniref:Uncharacterized protein n=1 Tax=Hypocrea virens (strain Gv29-8 / FGSC 10586) TaxID=413071 RepID=G9N0H4_HYPVG|nr:uncharacterized protein TRIVIDRAFT_203424 [Trichoderma virens Gv29-8]EHK19856.1 hypothetical protein TRIVIDRAFT_203424 [Trichoderma virens Gv29-8]UKZ53238.1 hypothetical protein TrVGV298_007030 [Trichoderma virens]
MEALQSEVLCGICNIPIPLNAPNKPYYPNVGARVVQLYYKIVEDEQLNSPPAWEVTYRPKNPSQDREDLHRGVGVYIYPWDILSAEAHVFHGSSELPLAWRNESFPLPD